MNDVRLDSLTLEGFRSFRSKQVISLPRSGMVMIRGRSGHGKSNLALGISHALGYCPKPSTALQSWDWEENWGARVSLDINHTDLQVERGSKFKLVVDGESISGSAASKNERLAQAIGLEPDLLGALTYRPQRTFGLFLSMDDEEKKEFLTKLLDLGKFEREAEAAEKTLPDLTRAVEEAKSAQAQAQSLVDHLTAQTFPVQDETAAQAAVDAAKKLLAAAQTGLAEGQAKADEFGRHIKEGADDIYRGAMEGVRETEKEFAAARAARPPLPEVEVTSEENRLQDLLDKASGFLKKLQSEDKGRQYDIATQREQLQGKLADTRRIVASEQTLRRQLAEAQHRLDHLTQNTTCPTCSQEWRGSAEKERLISAVRAEVAQHEESLSYLPRAKSEVEKLETELKALVFVANPKIEQMLQAKSQAEQRLAAERVRAAGAREAVLAKYAMEDATQRTMIATAKMRAEAARNDFTKSQQANLQVVEVALRGVRQEVDRLSREHSTACLVLNGLQAQNKTQRANQQRRDRDLSAAEATLGTAIAAHEQAKAAEGKGRDFVSLVWSYLDKIFDEVLVEIAHEANTVLVRVPNAHHITLGFKSEVQAKTGKKKAKITPVVRIDGVERPFDGLSGGQTSVVELATDIAIRRVVTNRRQVHIGWMLLDEAFDGLGKAEKEACLEVLQVAAQDDLIMVVDHATEFRDHFSMFLDVSLDGGESKVSTSW